MTGGPITIFWFRRDLRIHDNHGLYRSLHEKGNVLPVFIFDSHILERLEDGDDRRVSFLYDQITRLHNELTAKKSTLKVLHGRPVEVFKELLAAHSIQAVYTNHDHEPYALQRDTEVMAVCEKAGATFHTFKDQTLFERADVLKQDGTPYTVYTPFMKRWRARMAEEGIPTYPSERHLDKLLSIHPGALPSLKELGFSRADYYHVPMVPEPTLLKAYAKQRDIPGIAGTTKLGVHLRFGTVSIRELIRLAQEQSETWLNELIWREFFMQILWHFPHVAERSFRKKYDAIPWRNDEEQFHLWCEGKTGYPMVDAGMRELRETGFMHNRVRMVVASFLTKHLLIDWRWGEAWFARWLMDHELASNNGNWQWAAGCGCDAAPYFRVFNPTLQLKRFDPDMNYVRQWVPEFDSLEYPEPMVDHREARELAISTYKLALS